MRRLAILVLLVVGLLIVADRVAVLAAERDVASRIEASEHLSSRPDVHIGGFPFLTQLVRGHYDDVEVTVHDLHAGPLPIDHVTAKLSGARVPFADVLNQDIGEILTDQVKAEVLLSYDDLNNSLHTDHVRLSQGRGGRVHVAASADVAGTTLSAGADVPAKIDGSALTIDAVGGIQLRVPLPGLPFHTHLNTAKATADGIVVAGSADGLVLRP